MGVIKACLYVGSNGPVNWKRDGMLSGAIPYCPVFKMRKDRIKKTGGGMGLYQEKEHFIIYYRKEGRHLDTDTGEW